MKFSLLFIFLFLLVLAPFISAVPPTQTNVNINVGYTLEVTHVDFQENGEDHEYNVHLFNISDGLPLTNATIQCDFHLFDHDGFHILDEVPMDFDEVNGHWDYLVLGNNFTRNGVFSTLISCNSTVLGGFIFSEFEVTQDGEETIVFPQQFSIILFGLILIMFGISKERYTFMKSMGSFILMIMGILTLFPGYNNISHTSLFGLVLGSTVFVMGFYFLIEHNFSRTKQEQWFDQDQGEGERRGVFKEEDRD